MKIIYNYLIKTLICINLFLIVAIVCKNNQEYSLLVQNKVYSSNISFSEIKNFYNNYLGGIFPLDNNFFYETKEVFNENLSYKSTENYNDGAILDVGMYYLVPSIDNGIVVYIGEKEKYGKVIIVENSNGIDVWYGNMCSLSVGLYDSITKGDYLGEVCDNNLYLVFTRNNEFLDYNNYLG